MQTYNSFSEMVAANRVVDSIGGNDTIITMTKNGEYEDFLSPYLDRFQNLMAHHKAELKKEAEIWPSNDDVDRDYDESMDKLDRIFDARKARKRRIASFANEVLDDLRNLVDVKMLDSADKALYEELRKNVLIASRTYSSMVDNDG